MADFTRDHRAAFDLIHGSAAARRDALAYVVRRDAVAYWWNSMRGPRRLETAEAALRARYENEPQDGANSRQFGDVLARRGRVREALRRFPRGTRNGASLRLGLVLYGVLDPDSLRGLDWGDDPQDKAFAALAMGDTAILAGAIDALRTELEQLFDRRPEMADDPLGSRALALLELMEALALWRSEGAEAAERPLLVANEAGPSFAVDLVLWLLGEFYQDLGDERRAFEFYRASAQSLPYAALRAARLADSLGETEEARRLYSELLIAWQDADPEFGAWLDEARGWLERIPG
jgi:tetratricopeptide (TPR) repeat protein